MTGTQFFLGNHFSDNLIPRLESAPAWPVKVTVMIQAGLLSISLGTFTASWERDRFLLFLVTKLVGYKLGARSAHLCHFLRRANFALTETEANTVSVFLLRVVDSLCGFLTAPHEATCVTAIGTIRGALDRAHNDYWYHLYSRGQSRP